MKSLILTIIVGFSIAGELSQATTLMRAEEYMRLTAFSERILLIDIKEVNSRVTKTEGGLEFREVNVVGTVVETIRGPGVGKDFVHKSHEFSIVDHKKAEMTHSADRMELLRMMEGTPHLPSACTVGHRYLVIYLQGSTYFINVAKDNENWRKNILKEVP